MAREGKVHIRVADDAGGFSAQRLHEPFELFKTTREEGLGLGLVISQRLMQAQEGTLSLANSATGAEVTLCLSEEPA
jgi:two-component system, LuxR family, sensor histidine kinase TtrS